MDRQLRMLFLMAASCCSTMLLAGLPELPPLPSLSDVAKPVGASDASLSKFSGGDKGAVLDGRANVIDTQILDSQGKDLSGSWWKKRHWLLKAREQQEKINALVADIQAQGLPLYDAKRALFNKDVSVFYEKIGMERGEVDALLEELSPYFSPGSKEAEGQLVSKNSSYLASSKKFQDYFDATVMVAQLKADLKAVADYDAGVNERVAQYEKTCQQAVQKAAEAQSVINDMFALVSHEAARDSYYKLEGIVGYLDAVLKFVKNDLASDLDRVVGLARTKMDDISKVVSNARAACEKIKNSSQDQKEGASESVTQEKTVTNVPDELAKSDERAAVDSEPVAEESKEPLNFWERIKVFLMSFI